MPRAILPWLLPRVCQMSSSSSAHAWGRLVTEPSGWACCSSCPIGHTGKQLSAFIRKVETLASGYVRLEYYWICLLITSLFFFPCFGVNAYISQCSTCPRFKEINSVNHKLYLWHAIPVISGVLGARSESRGGQRKAQPAKTFHSSGDSNHE